MSHIAHIACKLIYQFDWAPPGGAPVHDLPVVDEVGHGADDLLDGAAGVVLVDEDEVDVVHLQVPQRLLHRLDYLLPRQRPVGVPRLQKSNISSLHITNPN